MLHPVCVRNGEKRQPILPRTLSYVSIRDSQKSRRHQGRRTAYVKNFWVDKARGQRREFAVSHARNIIYRYSVGRLLAERIADLESTRMLK